LRDVDFIDEGLFQSFDHFAVYFLFAFLRPDAGRFAMCPAQRASFIIRACAALFCGLALSHFFEARADAAGSPFSFLDITAFYILPQALSRPFRKHCHFCLDILAEGV